MFIITWFLYTLKKSVICAEISKASCNLQNNLDFGSCDNKMFVRTFENAPISLQKKSQSNPFVIAVLDSGIDINDKYLISKSWLNHAETHCHDGFDNDNNGYIDDCLGWNFCTNNAFPIDDHGHGSEVARCILQFDDSNNTACENCTLMYLKVLNRRKIGTRQALEKALEYAINHKANVINCSFNLAENRTTRLLKLVERAGNAGIQLVTSLTSRMLSNTDYLANVHELITKGVIFSLENGTIDQVYELFSRVELRNLFSLGEDFQIIDRDGSRRKIKGVSYATAKLSSKLANIHKSDVDSCVHGLENCLNSLTIATSKLN